MPAGILRSVRNTTSGREWNTAKKKDARKKEEGEGEEREDLQVWIRR